LRMGVDPNYQHPEYFTAPLFDAIRNGHLEVIDCLLQHGAHAHVKEDYTGKTPLVLAMEEKRHAVVDRLLKILPEKERTPVKNIVVTGGNRGIGKAIAQQCLEQGHQVLITARSTEKAAQAQEELRIATGNQKVSYVVGNLSSVQATKALGLAIVQAFPTIQVLIHNAGHWPAERQLNEDGLELAFMVNFLAPYLLTEELLPGLKKQVAARIVLVNAGLYPLGRPDPQTTPTGDDFHRIRTYAATKQVSVFHLQELAERLKGSTVTVNAVHPGIIDTGLGDSPLFLSRLVKWMKRFWKKPSYGALAPCYLALHPDLEGINGHYYQEQQAIPLAEKVKDPIKRAAWKHWTESFLQKQANTKPLST
ncbi:MAG: ankyrin repeat domain-containing protein, partial [Bacteroidota bacterium]